MTENYDHVKAKVTGSQLTKHPLSGVTVRMKRGVKAVVLMFLYTLL